MINQRLLQTISELKLVLVDKERQEELKPLIDFIQYKISSNQIIRLNFICTHNSRRSHFAQIWAQALAFHFAIEKVTCYSGGTEATAVFPTVIETLLKQGFEYDVLSQENNLIYSIKYAINEPAVIAFSKKYDHKFNPQSEFTAIMTCSQADAGCPFIAGAEKRIPITYEDPKLFDNSPLQAEKYLERSLQIASELFYVFSKLKTNQ